MRWVCAEDTIVGKLAYSSIGEKLNTIHNESEDDLVIGCGDEMGVDYERNTKVDLTVELS